MMDTERLAELLEQHHTVFNDTAAAMLRRQHEAIVKLRKALDSCLTFMEPFSSDGQTAYENGNQALKDTREI